MKIKITAYNIAIAVILLLILIIVSLFVFVNPNKRPVHKNNVNMNEIQPATTPKPVFRKDGELRFVDAKSFKVISEINIEVADNDAEREQGLMYRDSMADNNGMLFLMGTEDMQAFWMKNTIMPLDIMFVDAERRIVNIQKNCKPFSLDQIPSAKPALYVVEVNAGYADKYGIKAGDLISF
jgi:uncharacterized protein